MCEDLVGRRRNRLALWISADIVGAREILRLNGVDDRVGDRSNALNASIGNGFVEKRHPFVSLRRVEETPLLDSGLTWDAP